MVRGGPGFGEMRKSKVEPKTGTVMGRLGTLGQMRMWTGEIGSGNGDMGPTEMEK